MTGISSSRQIWMTESRVMPGRIEEESGGVITLPLETRKMFSPEPSETKPRSSSAMPSA